MSRLRPTLIPGMPGCGLGYKATYFRILQAVSGRRALIHGRLNDSSGGTCAIGAYFRTANVPINSEAIEEIAAYNDSFPRLSSTERWRKVIAWLRFHTKAMEHRER